jgi:hypothetical protein
MNREQSTIIKGFAILFMFMYHLTNIEGVSQLLNIVERSICHASHPISYFLIVSGYGLYCSYNQGRMTWLYLMKRTLKLYIAFWLVLLFFIGFVGSVFYPGTFSLSLQAIITNFSGWRWDYCHFTWFLLPYILTSLCSKWIFRIFDQMSILVAILGSMIFFLTTSWIISRYFDTWLQWNYWAYHPVLVLQTLFPFIIGATAARLTLKGCNFKLASIVGKNVLIVLLIVVTILIRGQIHTSVVNPFQAAFICWLVLHMSFSSVPKYVFMELGDKSMFMWFIQGFVAVKMFSEYYIQLKSPIIILLVWIMICYFISYLFSIALNRITKYLKLA